MKKAFCRQCVYHKKEEHNGSNCTHHDNTDLKDTWYDQMEEYKREPSAINRENNCQWFKPLGF